MVAVEFSPNIDLYAQNLGSTEQTPSRDTAPNNGEAIGPATQEMDVVIHGLGKVLEVTVPDSRVPHPSNFEFPY